MPKVAKRAGRSGSGSTIVKRRLAARNSPPRYELTHALESATHAATSIEVLLMELDAASDRTRRRIVGRLETTLADLRTALDKARRAGASGNPPGDLMSTRVLKLFYVHKGDGREYVHDFKPGVSMLASDKRVTLFRPDGRDVSQNF